MWREIERVLFHCKCVIKLPIETDTRRVPGQQFYFSFTPFSKMRMLNLRCSRHSAMKFWGRYFFTSIYTLYFFMFSKTRSVNPLNSFESFSIPIKSNKAWITEWLSTLVSLDALPKRKKDSQNRGPTNGVFFNPSIKK